jgi:Dyp-type peroxidase family
VETTSKHVNTATELTCVLPIKEGFAPVVDTITFATRMRIAFKVLQRLRVASREVTGRRTILDTVEAARTVHAFSWTILAERNLLLNVVFDRPWEPYIRVVWRDLGPLLDLFLCNCAGYPSSEAPFDEFATYVRQHQVETSFFYPASSFTVDDQRYLVELERLQRSGVADFDKRAATLIADGPEETAAEERGGDARTAIEQWLTVLNALYSLRAFYPEGTDDHRFLRRTAKALLESSRPAVPPRLAAAYPPLEWYDKLLAAASSAKAAPRDVDRTNVQGGILHGYRRVSHGCLLLATITDARKAREFVGGLTDSISRDTEEEPRDNSVFRNIAFTSNGLRRLEVAESTLAQFPKEFREGMEARAGLLGDVRENHPDRWERPEWNVRFPAAVNGVRQSLQFVGSLNGGDDGSRPRVRLSAVDVVFTLQLVGQWHTEDRGEWAGHPLREEVTRFCELARDNGIAVVSVQPLRRLRRQREAPSPESKRTWWSRDHFNFVDGLSQPEPVPKPDAAQTNQVDFGELLVGFKNGRGDSAFDGNNGSAALTQVGSLIDAGSFLVVRKLAQNVEALDDAITRQDLGKEELLAKMMGRSRDGLPLRPAGAQIHDPRDPFDFTGDEAGATCPFHSHIRRSNPRAQFAADGTTRPFVPRIARRSLAYGPTTEEAGPAERGMMFMAFNASIAEQFEAIQRWMSGGNAVGERGSVSVFSGQPDPLLGLPDAAGQRFFQFVDQAGNVRHVDLGQPFVTVRWGLYLFAPSIAALRLLAKEPGVDAERIRQTVDEGGRIIDQLHTSNDWAAALEDVAAMQSGVTAAVSATISLRDGGVRRTPYGVLVASAELVKHVLEHDELFSVKEYQRRFKLSVGESYLGMDGGPEYDAASKGPNDAVMSVKDDEVFREAYELTARTLNKRIESARASYLAAGGDPQGSAPLPLMPILAEVLARLAKSWFDIPDVPDSGENMDGRFFGVGTEPGAASDPPRCPFHFLAPSRYVFSSPNPREIVETRGAHDGQQLLEASRRFVEWCRAQPGGGLLHVHGPISRKLFEEITDDDERLARVLVGLVFGFVPTVYGNAASVLSQWLQDETLWRLQLVEGDPDERTSRVRDELYRAMLKNAVPALLHRTVTAPTTLGGCQLEVGERVVLLMSGAAQEMLVKETLAKVPLDPAIVFGGDRDLPNHPLHACPGKHLAIGALIGILTALLDVGELKPSPAQVTVLVPAVARQEVLVAVPLHR